MNYFRARIILRPFLSHDSYINWTRAFRVFLNVFYITFMSFTAFTQWSNIFLVDQDERQRCFFVISSPARHKKFSWFPLSYQKCRNSFPRPCRFKTEFEYFQMERNSWVKQFRIETTFWFGNAFRDARKASHFYIQRSTGNRLSSAQLN
jgi:hypothetical protein